MRLIKSTFSGFLLAASATGALPPNSDMGDIEFFEKKIRPVLAEYCYECHSHQAKKLKAGLYLDSREGALKGGETGVAIVLGEPDKSRLIEAIRYLNPDFQMPPKRKLPDSAIAALTEWVKIGAPWPAEEGPIASAARMDEIEKRKHDHWAWKPLRDPPLPKVKDQQRLKNPIDALVMAGWEAAGLSGMPRADRRALIRRAYFDLIGLPPSPEAIEAFEHDRSPNPFAKVVETLLANPHYGERWGRHWLDVARYGEDQAHSFKPRLYPQGFRYRDWLVRAFNQDMPYDRFILEQIAGDLLPGRDRIERLPALGFFALGPVYYGDSKMFDQLDDRIDTLTRGFLGLTVACARCHDHKYDPISTQDYYALAGVFVSSEYIEAPLVAPEVAEVYHRAQSEIEAQTKKIDQFIDQEMAKLNQSLLENSAQYLMAAWSYPIQRQTLPKLTVEQLAKNEGLHPVILERWSKYLGRPKSQAKPQLARWYDLLDRHQPSTNACSDESVRSEFRQAARAFQDYLVTVDQLKKAMSRHQAAAAALSGEPSKDGLPSFSLDKSQTALLEDFVGKDGVFAPPKDQLEKLMPPESRSQLADMRSHLENLRKRAPEKYPFAHSLKEGSKPRNLPVLRRGNPDTPGEEVPRRFPALLAGYSASAFTNGSGRLELAQAISDKRNPLTARVMVNRIWQHHFGHGLVRTPSNFGLLGEPPTHPELLDYLASRFIESGWSIKAMHRLIMLSATYQMSSQFNARHHQLDPDNQWLWRMNQRRLEVEAWRDAMLAVSGCLDRTIGGASLALIAPDNRRRTFYAKVSRHELDSLLRLFDFPDPNVTSDIRTVTTVPLQELFVLNSEFMVRQAKGLARRITAAAPSNNAERIRMAFLLVYGRDPKPQELQLGLEFLEADSTQHSPAPSASDSLSKWEQYAQVLLSANEFMYVD